MPLVVWVLCVAVFVQGTSELMIAGLLPEIASDLGVSIPDAGLLISAFAVGMLVGAPVLAIVTRRWPPRLTLLVFLGVFAIAHVVGALAGDYETLLFSRMVSAFVCAGFWAVAAVTAVGAVPADTRGRALSVVLGGVTVAVLVGLPAGTAVGQAFGWRAAFWVVAAGSVLMMLGIALTLPRTRRSARAETTSLRDELRALARPSIALAQATTALSIAALIVTYSYLAPIITDAMGLTPGWVPAVLALYGVGALVGIAVGGRMADRHPSATLVVGLVALVVVSVALALLAGVPAVALPLIVLLGAAGFGISPALNTRVFALAEGAPTLAAATNITSFNVGVTVGPLLGGLVIATGAAAPTVSWVGAALGVAALGAVGVAALTATRATTATTPPTEPETAPACPSNERSPNVRCRT